MLLLMLLLVPLLVPLLVLLLVLTSLLPLQLRQGRHSRAGRTAARLPGKFRSLVELLMRSLSYALPRVAPSVQYSGSST